MSGRERDIERRRREKAVGVARITWFTEPVPVSRNSTCRVCGIAADADADTFRMWAKWLPGAKEAAA